MFVNWEAVSAIGSLATASAAVAIAIRAHMFAKRQTDLTLVNQNNSMANEFNQMMVNSESARQIMSKFRTPIIGSPHDAIMFMYLNYVHNAYRTNKTGANVRQRMAGHSKKVHKSADAV